MNLNLAVPAPASNRGEWAASIRDMWTTAADAFIGAGRELIDAKAHLPHGEFEAMVESDLPFGPRTARCLMAIAADPRIADSDHAERLPASWGTLYQLTRLDDEAFERAIAIGDINPDMERRDAERLRIGGPETRRCSKGGEPPERVTDTVLGEYINEFNKTLGDCTHEELNALKRRLGKRLLFIEHLAHRVPPMHVCSDFVSDDEAKKLLLIVSGDGR